jgi:predicted branched-subunit amino acid permease
MVFECSRRAASIYAGVISAAMLGGCKRVLVRVLHTLAACRVDLFIYAGASEPAMRAPLQYIVF